jgi:type IV secretory pathway VirB2 component (pilin)
MYKNHQSMFNASAFKKHLPAVVGVLLMAAVNVAFAAGGDELGGGVCSLVNLLTGKYLFGTAVLAMVGGGVALLFGAELTDGVKKMVTVVTIVGMILSFGGILSMAYSAMSSASCS